MKYVIAEPCIDVKNRARVDVCSVSSISIADEVTDWLLYISPGLGASGWAR